MQAARKSRQKRKAYVEDLEAEVERLRAQVDNFASVGPLQSAEVCLTRRAGPEAEAIQYQSGGAANDPTTEHFLYRFMEWRKACTLV